MKIFLGISGASGTIYGGRLLAALLAGGHQVTVCVSDGALDVMRHEEGAPGVVDKISDTREDIVAAFLDRYMTDPQAVAELAGPADMASAFASGSALADAAVVCPCSMSTLASMAAGITRNLIHRVADVMLKESRPLVVVPRETPLSRIHLQNMLRLQEAGARIVPAMPAFYHYPETIDDLADFIAGKVLDALGIENRLFERWKGS